MPVGDDHETRISRLEFRMDIIADKQEREASERKEDYREIIRELKTLREETNRQRGRQEQRVANLKIAGVVVGALSLFVALGWIGQSEAAPVAPVRAQKELKINTLKVAK